MTVNIYLSIDTSDANQILCQYDTIIPAVSELFESAKKVDNSGKEIQFQLTIDADIAEWCQGLVNDEKDDTGVFSQILETYHEKKR